MDRGCLDAAMNLSGPMPLSGCTSAVGALKQVPDALGSKRKLLPMDQGRSRPR